MKDESKQFEQPTGSLTSATYHSASHSKAGSEGRLSGVWTGRILFLTCLGGVAAALGYSAYTVITNAETDLAEKQFDSMADRALFSARGITTRKNLGTVSMASIVANQRPDAAEWPFVSIHGYEEIATNIIGTSSGREIGFFPFVQVDDLTAFEDFAYDLFEKNFPGADAGVSSFGKGVFGINPALNTTDNRYPMAADGSTNYESPNKFFAPFLQHSQGAIPVLMLDLRFEETRGNILDRMIECTEENVGSEEPLECGSFSDILILASNPDPGAVITQPVYPANNKNVLVGVVQSSIVWAEVLENVFTAEVRGVDCVLETENQVYTYEVIDGAASLKGEGDLHDVKCEEYRQSALLTGEGRYGKSSATYTLTLYPNSQYFDVYSTDNPRTATIGAVCIIIFTSIMFFLFDFFVRREFKEKRSLLEAKRKFVRFVSHEVRTPLNSVCMGLRLMREELGADWVDPQATAIDGETVSQVGLEALTKKDDTKGERENANKASLLVLSQDILTNAESAVDVLNDLLNYDKVQMGELALEFSIIPIWKAIEQVVEEFRLPANSKNIDLKMDFSALVDTNKDDVESAMHVNKLPHEVLERRVVGDFIRITQVMRNLISNALKFAPDESEIIVRLEWVRPQDGKDGQSHTFDLSGGEEVSYAESGYIQVKVSDTGAGMTKEQLSQLFTPGVQFNVNELQNGQGSGLGLYITKGIVEQHEGTLAASSKGLQQGTTFRVTFPLFHVPDSALPDRCKHLKICQPLTSTLELSNSKPAKGHSVKFDTLRLLVVDDALSNRKLLTRLLERRGHQVDDAKDGLEAVNKVKVAMESDTPYDSILMDYEMPVMDGPTAAKEIRSLGCDSFLVGITGNVLPEDIAHFKKCGAHSVFPKPLQLPLLESLWTEYGVTGRKQSEWEAPEQEEQPAL